MHIPDSKVHGANMGPIWGRQGPDEPHVVPMNLAIWDVNLYIHAYALRQIDIPVFLLNNSFTQSIIIF